jgi:hypothetical protein
LGIVLAANGRRDEALHAAQLALVLKPLSKDAMDGGVIAEMAATTYVLLGEYDAALDLLEPVVSRPGQVFAHDLRLDPTWKALRGNPRFEKMIADNLPPGT